MGAEAAIVAAVVGGAIGGKLLTPSAQAPIDPTSVKPPPSSPEPTKPSTSATAGLTDPKDALRARAVGRGILDRPQSGQGKSPTGLNYA